MGVPAAWKWNMVSPGAERNLRHQVYSHLLNDAFQLSETLSRLGAISMGDFQVW